MKSKYISFGAFYVGSAHKCSSNGSILSYIHDMMIQKKKKSCKAIKIMYTYTYVNNLYVLQFGERNKLFYISIWTHFNWQHIIGMHMHLILLIFLLIRSAKKLCGALQYYLKPCHFFFFIYFCLVRCAVVTYSRHSQYHI